MSPWLRELPELLHSGRRADAIALVRTLAAQGNLAAKVRLARFGEEAGLSRPDSDEIVDQADRECSDDDPDVHWVLYGAYEVGLGTCDYEERSRRALKHLKSFAVLTGDPTAAHAVAVIYGQGNIGTAPDAEQAKLWLQREADARAQNALRQRGGDA